MPKMLEYVSDKIPVASPEGVDAVLAQYAELSWGLKFVVPTNARDKSLLVIFERNVMPTVNETQIAFMVARFLNWKLPLDFNPSGGISFHKVGGYDPVGTNLFNAAQAMAMIRYMIDGLPPDNTGTPAGAVVGGLI